MANPVWPISLPSKPLEDGFDETLPFEGVRSSIDGLPLVQRQQSQASTRPLSLTAQMTNAQVDIFQAFFRSTLGFGALRFDWTHPRTGATATFRFIPKQPPVTTPQGYDTYRVSLSLQVLP